MTEVLYLSYDGMTDPLGQSQVIPYLAGLSRKGFHFHLVSFEKKENFRKEHEPVARLLREADVAWHPLTYTKYPPVISTMRDLGKMKRYGRALIQKHNIAIIHCRSYISGLAGLTLSRQTGARFLFDMRGFWADERVDGKLWNLANPVYRAVYKYFKRKEREMIASADAVISLTEKARHVIGSWAIRDASLEPVAVIPCCADLGLFNRSALPPGSVEKLRNKLEIPEGIPVISYLGALGTWYLLDDMMDFFRVFRTRYPDALFLFITRDHPGKIEESASRKGVPANALRVYAARRSEVPVALELSQASLFFIKPAFSKIASSPTKQGEIMGMGIPVICNSGIGDTDSVVTKYGSGWVIDLGAPGVYEQAADRFESLRAIPPEEIRRGASDFYSLESGVEKYLAVYRRLLR